MFYRLRAAAEVVEREEREKIEMYSFCGNDRVRERDVRSTVFFTMYRKGTKEEQERQETRRKDSQQVLCQYLQQNKETCSVLSLCRTVTTISTTISLHTELLCEK
jgi:hypothetical protein